MSGMVDDRLVDDRKWMSLALKLAAQAARSGEVPIGAVVVQESTLVGQAHNQPVGSHDPTAHAEILALRQAGLRVGNYRLAQCRIYVTLEPCLMCVGAMIHARLERLVYGAADAKVGAAGLVQTLAERHALNHKLKVTSGVMDAEAATMLRQYFRERRAHPASAQQDSS